VSVVKHGNKLDLNKMEQCKPSETDAIAFIGRSGEDNGIASFVRRKEGLKPYDAGLITVALGGAALSSFVQPKPFYTAQNIDVLVPREEMSLDQKLYYCLCIRANIFRYSAYGREANRTLKNLMVPKRKHIPQWVDGITREAVEDLNRDLRVVVQS
jgi:hypothetical protein